MFPFEAADLYESGCQNATALELFAEVSRNLMSGENRFDRMSERMAGALGPPARGSARASGSGTRRRLLATVSLGAGMMIFKPCQDGVILLSVSSASGKTRQSPRIAPHRAN